MAPPTSMAYPNCSLLPIDQDAGGRLCSGDNLLTKTLGGKRKMRIKCIIVPLTVALLVGGALPVSNAFGSANDANGVGEISLPTGSVERIGVEPDSIINFQSQVITASGAGDAGAKIVTAIAACPAAGCVVDARGVTGTISQDMFAGVTKPITLLLGAGTYVVTVPQTYVTST